MHERQAALTGAILALMFLTAVPARAEKDAAIKVQEGSVDHWIEYYRKNRDPAAAPPATPQSGAVSGEEKEKPGTTPRFRQISLFPLALRTEHRTLSTDQLLHVESIIPATIGLSGS